MQCSLLRKVSILFLLFLVFLGTQATIITADNKCFGNNVFINSKCQPCPAGQIAQNNKCMKQPQSNFGTNLNQKGTSTSSTVVVESCVKKSAVDANICIQCNKNYQLIRGSCVQKDCKIYSQALNKCLDSLLSDDLQKLAEIYSKSKEDENNKEDQSQFVLGSIAISGLSQTQTQINLQLPNETIQLQKNNQQNKEQAENSEGQNNQDIDDQDSGPKSSVKIQKKQVNPCIDRINEKCTRCIEGYFLDLLSNQCKHINQGIKINLPTTILGSNQDRQNVNFKTLFKADKNQLSEDQNQESNQIEQGQSQQAAVGQNVQNQEQFQQNVIEQNNQE